MVLHKIKRYAIFILLVLVYSIISFCATFSFSSAQENNLTKIKNITSRGSVIFIYLSNSDYLNVEYSNKNYNWDTAGDGLAIGEDRYRYNSYNQLFESDRITDMNFFDKIFIDGVKLRYFSDLTFGFNKFQRAETFCIISPTAFNGQKIRIEEGCEFPSASYGYYCDDEYSSFVLDGTIEYDISKNTSDIGDIIWVEHFEYAEGGLYDVDKVFLINGFTEINQEYEFRGLKLRGLNTISTVNFDVFDGCEKLLYNNYFWINNSSDPKDFVYYRTGEEDVVGFKVDFSTPIDSKQFDYIEMRIYCTTVNSWDVYNVNELINGVNGVQPKDSFSWTGQGFKNVRLFLRDFANDKGMVDSILFYLPESYDRAGQIFIDCLSIPKLVDESKASITEDSLKIREVDENYIVSFEFNKAGEALNRDLDTNHIKFNDILLSDILANSSGITAKYNEAKRYGFKIIIPKTYEGNGKVINPDLDYVRNKLTILDGFVFPDNSINEVSTTVHIQMLDNIVDYDYYTLFDEVELVGAHFVKEHTWYSNMVSKEDPTVKGRYVENITIELYFSKPVSGAVLYYACMPESYRSVCDPVHYDKYLATTFLSYGYQSSLLDNVLINGRTIGEWMMWDTSSAKNTCIHSHYGNGSRGKNGIGIHLDDNSKVWEYINDLYENNDEIVIQVKKGLKFTTQCETRTDYTYVYKDGNMYSINSQNLTVFYDGEKVEYGECITTNSVATINNISIDGMVGYVIDSEKSENTTTFTIKDENGEEVMSFAVIESLIQEKEEKSGCNALSMPLVLSPLGLVVLFIRRKKYE